MEYKPNPVAWMTDDGRLCSEATRKDMPRSVQDSYSTPLYAAAPSPEWVNVSERLPTREDADDDEHLWVVGRNGVTTDHWGNSPYYGYWMPKPRQQLPAPPTEVPESRPFYGSTPQEPPE